MARLFLVTATVFLSTNSMILVCYIIRYNIYCTNHDKIHVVAITIMTIIKYNIIYVGRYSQRVL